MKSKICPFCSKGLQEIDYKQHEHLKKFMSVLGKIETRRRTGACVYHQKSLSRAIKRARHIALLPFVIS
ncbi:30S ribosomal protein S18 [Candidatus Microgenomates bacterium]|nr:30S ribosomal protein S18 [Candidatus Microgenomates bacterium]